MKQSTNPIVLQLQEKYRREIATNATFPGRPSQELYNHLIGIFFQNYEKN